MQISDRWHKDHFNPRSHEGSDVCTATVGLRHPEFQSALPRGERHINREMPEYTFEFQSALPRGERRGLPGGDAVNQIFQSALPRGERQILELLNVMETYFNPRSHEGSDEDSEWDIDLLHISIRAPTRGATEISGTFADILMISIRAPTRGATI